MRFPAKIISSCIWVAIAVGWVILHWYACGADGRSVSSLFLAFSGERCEVKRSTKKINAREEAYGHVITKISRMGRLPNFLSHSAPLRARGAPLLVDYPPPRGVGGATLKLLEALAACEQKRLVAGVGIPISLVGWFSNRTGTSDDDDAPKSNNWLDQRQSGKLGTRSRV